MTLGPDTPLVSSNVETQAQSVFIPYVLLVAGILLLFGGYLLLRAPKEEIEAPLEEYVVELMNPAPEISEDLKQEMVENLSRDIPVSLSDSQKQKMIDELQR